MDKPTNDARAQIFARLDLLNVPAPDAPPAPEGPLAWLDAAPVICDFCRQTVTYAQTKIEVEPIEYGRPVPHGFPTSLEIRVCSHH